MIYNLSILNQYYFGEIPIELYESVDSYFKESFIKILTDSLSKFYSNSYSIELRSDAKEILYGMDKTHLKYHNFKHPLHIISLCNKYYINLDYQHYLFLLFHDSYYGKGEKSSEYYSAENFSKIVHASYRNFDKFEFDQIYAAILASEHHFKPWDRTTFETFCLDLDLLPLTEDYNYFFKLSEYVIFEYMHINNKFGKYGEIKSKRQDFLRNLLHLDEIIKSLPNKKELNEKIKYNIKRYIDEKQTGSTK
jgi:hypothetical protein